MNQAALRELLDELANLIADAVVRRLREGDPTWVDQVRSPLGPRRHCAATKRRIEQGRPGATKIGRRYLLSPEALEEELARPRKPVVDTSGEQAVRELRAELNSLPHRRGKKRL